MGTGMMVGDRSIQLLFGCLERQLLQLPLDFRQKRSLTVVGHHPNLRSKGKYQGMFVMEV
jgi:hypothetical protein